MTICIGKAVDSFYDALEEASDNEHILREIAIESVSCNNSFKIIRLKEIAVIELKDYYKKLVDTLKLQYPFFSIDCNIQSFADALLLTAELRPFIVQLLFSPYAQTMKMLLDNIVNCCYELRCILPEPLLGH